MKTVQRLRPIFVLCLCVVLGTTLLLSSIAPA